MPLLRIRWLLTALLLVACLATAAGQVVYKWKDSGGNVHFTDTVPPPGATLLKGPRPAPVAQSTTAVDDKPMLSEQCRPDVSAAECDAARRSLQVNLEDLERTAQQVRESSAGTVSDDKAKRQAIASRANECSMWRDVLASLEDRQNDKNTERLTASARAALPAQIAEAERQIAGSCN